MRVRLGVVVRTGAALDFHRYDLDHRHILKAGPRSHRTLHYRCVAIGGDVHAVRRISQDADRGRLPPLVPYRRHKHEGAVVTRVPPRIETRWPPPTTIVAPPEQVLKEQLEVAIGPIALEHDTVFDGILEIVTMRRGLVVAIKESRNVIPITLLVVLVVFVHRRGSKKRARTVPLQIVRGRPQIELKHRRSDGRRHEIAKQTVATV